MKTIFISIIGCLLVLITGCASTSHITNEYPLKQDMTEEQAIKILNQYLSFAYPKFDSSGGTHYAPGEYPALDGVTSDGFNIYTTHAIIDKQYVSSVQVLDVEHTTKQIETEYHFTPYYEDYISFSKIKSINLTRQPLTGISQIAWVVISSDLESGIGHRQYLDKDFKYTGVYVEDFFKCNYTNIVSETIPLGYVGRPSCNKSEDTLVVSALLTLCHNAK